MKKLKSRFENDLPVGMAGINKSLRLETLSFKPIELNFIDRIQNFYQSVLQNLKVLYP